LAAISRLHSPASNPEKELIFNVEYNIRLFFKKVKLFFKKDKNMYPKKLGSYKKNKNIFLN
jgi:hypothetical protein